MKKFITLLLTICFCFSAFGIGCTGGGGKPTLELKEHDTYSNEISKFEGDEFGINWSEKSTNFSSELFYRNGYIWVGMGDPCVVPVTDPLSPYYGQAFLYGTTGGQSYSCFNSTDMVTWDSFGVAYKFKLQFDKFWQNADCWAPEFIYDPSLTPEDYGLTTDPQYEDAGVKQGMYFLLYSSTVYMNTSAKDWGYAYGTNMFNYYHQQGIAFSKYPGGP
ncbi:MAG: hypothetical protein MJ072_05430, partial [Clostridia bacterium]|nr:hypothetical protein [Clostridia bacterium]